MKYEAVTKGLAPNVEMKPSGVEWIGEVPTHWKIGKIKHIATLVSEKSTPETNAIKISPENVESETGKILDFYSSYDAVGVKFQTGDVLFNKLRVYLNKVVFAEYDGYSLGEMVVIRPSLQDIGKYLFYLMLSNRFIEYCNAISYGVRMPRTAVDDILNAKIPMTSDQEQAQIANFLDHKTEQIDEFIRIKERQIELLQEQRTALINQAVTKGLDPNVEMKPSGVEWIGKIPRHWDLSMLKFAARLVYGDTLIAENRENGVVPVYGSNGIIDIHSSENTLSPAIIVGRKGSLGKIQYSDVPCFVIDTAYFIDRRTSHVNLRWLYYVLHALKLERFRNSVLPGLNREDTEGQYVPLITAEEQDRIANFLDHKTEQIDELISTEQQKIKLLKEYRQSLISEAVTGKIDVRNEV